MNGAGDFVGRGWAFPLRVGPRGGIALASGPDEIDASIRMIVSTAPGERVMRPEFGCAIWDLVFAPTDAGTIGLMAQAVREAIGRWEPRVDVEEVVATPDLDDPSRVLVEIRYVVRSTNDSRNLVYPFYVLPKEAP